MATEALAGLKVLDLTQHIAGSYCTKLMADYGAEVIKIEQPEIGDGTRRLGPFPGDVFNPEKSGIFLYLNTNKRGITLDLENPAEICTLKQLVAQTNILVESFRPGTLDRLGLSYETLSRLNPRLVMCSISNFGQTGPYRDYKATELVFQAMSGSMYSSGDPQKEPLWIPVYLAQQVAGLYAFIVALAAENYTRATGRGIYTEVSIWEAIVGLRELTIQSYFYSGEIAKRFGRRRKNFYPASILPCKDGYVLLYAVTNREWQDLTKLLGRPELVYNTRFGSRPDRAEHADEIDTIFLPWLAQHTSEELYRLAQGRRIPFAMVPSAAEVIESKQLKARGFFRQMEHAVAGKFVYPGPPFLMTETPAKPQRPAPLLGQDNDDIIVRELGYSCREFAVPALNRDRTSRDMTKLPLEGVRITDLTQGWAGGKCTQILSDLGAEIVKIESPRRPDPIRGRPNDLLSTEIYPNRDRGARFYNRSGNFNCINRNKYGINLDLRKESGIATFRQLVSISDVVIDNFSAGVMQRLNLDYKVLISIKPDIIQLSMSGFGSYGPDSEYIAWADTIEALAGLAYVTGYADGPPMSSFQSPSDPVAGIMGAVAVLTALRYQQETGKGQYIDLSQLEALTSLNVGPLIDWVMNGRIRGRQGNRHPNVAPHGCFPCRGQDDWIAIAVPSDEEWQQFVRALGSPKWAQEVRFAHVSGRLEHWQDLNGHIAEWTKRYSAAELEVALQHAGISAGKVLNIEEVVHDPQLKERRVFEQIDHLEVGPYSYYKPMSVWFPHIGLKARRPAPCFGQDNHYVLHKLLGISEEEIMGLERARVIASEPMWDG